MEVVDSCWLSHKAAVTILVRSLAGIIVVLQQQLDPAAVGLHSAMACNNIFASQVLLNDVLTIVNRLSVIFQ
jgi:hypothetical protein